jgi:hypothetical protein
MSDQLTELLKCWVVNASPDPNFGREVWRRIATQRRTPWWSYLLAELSHPAGALAAMAFMISVGWVAGTLSQIREETLARTNGEEAYAQAVNPVLHATNHRQ